MADPQSRLIAALQNPALYPHAVEKFQVIETHISWVILTGPYAYKIKKAINLGFLDFSTLEKRHYYCQEELRLNRRLAPELYLDVIAISGSSSNPGLDSRQPVIEYAVKMRQFDPSAQLDRLAGENRLDSVLIQQLAELVAAFHGRIKAAPAASSYGNPDVVRKPVLDNFILLREILAETMSMNLLERLQAWEETTFAHIGQELMNRKKGGFIRECHGDMHLGNMVICNNRVVIFDCLEFNESLRWIDVMSEVAFLVMDLDDRGLRELGYQFLNRYLEITGDYQGITVLPYYLAYRALVRAKVASIRYTQSGSTIDEKKDFYLECLDYLQLAERYTQVPHPVLIITHGLSGCGKTTLSGQLAPILGLIRIRSDIERKRLFRLEPGSSSNSAIDTGIYSADASRKTYHYLVGLAESLIAAGSGVIIDAAFLKQWQRQLFSKLADKMHIPFIILDIHGDLAVLEKRVIDRMHTGTDASEADLTVLRHQQKTQDELKDKERRYVLSINTGKTIDIAQLIARIKDTAKEQVKAGLLDISP